VRVIESLERERDGEDGDGGALSEDEEEEEEDDVEAAACWSEDSAASIDSEIQASTGNPSIDWYVRLERASRQNEHDDAEEDIKSDGYCNRFVRCFPRRRCYSKCGR
jgi:hypothetical protein